MKKGTRVRVNERITPGWGNPPKPGTLGTVDLVREDGTVIVLLDDGRRVLLGSAEIDSIDAN